MGQKKCIAFFLRIEWFWVKINKNFFTIFGSGGSIFGPFSGPFCPPGTKLKFFRSKRFSPVVSLYWPLIFGRKSLEPILRKIWKTLKNPLFDPIWPIFRKRGSFGKNRFPSLFSIYEALTSCKKAEKSLEPILRKSVNGQTDKHESIYRTNSLRGSNNNNNTSYIHHKSASHN